MFNDILSKIKRLVLEPKLYALLVSSTRGQVLHLGVHFSLEEAYSAARKRMEQLAPHAAGEAIDMQLWNSMPARQVVALITDPTKIDEVFQEGENQVITPIANGVIIGSGPLPAIFEELLKGTTKEDAPKLKHPTNEEPPTVIDHIQDLKASKNDLMKKLIEDGDVNQVEKVKDLLGAHSKRYVLKAIEKKVSLSSPVTPSTEEEKK